MDISEIRIKTAAMAGKVCDMLGLIEKGFMENRVELLSDAMQKEGALNEMEKTLTIEILALSKSSKTEGGIKELSAWQQAVEMLERMGDEAANLTERIEIKIAESLLFSESGVEQFNETYNAMKKSVDMMHRVLKDMDLSLKGPIIENGFRVKELVERYRKEHTDRLIKGLCSPIAANMYFDMLDFTGNLARHSSNIVKLFE